jgi:hypothetical protein
MDFLGAGCVTGPLLYPICGIDVPVETSPSSTGDPQKLQNLASSSILAPQFAQNITLSPFKVSLTFLYRYYKSFQF